MKVSILIVFQAVFMISSWVSLVNCRSVSSRDAKYHGHKRIVRSLSDEIDRENMFADLPETSTIDTEFQPNDEDHSQLQSRLTDIPESADEAKEDSKIDDIASSTEGIGIGTESFENSDPVSESQSESTGNANVSTENEAEIIKTETFDSDDEKSTINTENGRTSSGMPEDEMSTTENPSEKLIDDATMTEIETITTGTPDTTAKALDSSNDPPEKTIETTEYPRSVLDEPDKPIESTVENEKSEEEIPMNENPIAEIPITENPEIQPEKINDDIQKETSEYVTETVEIPEMTTKALESMNDSPGSSVETTENPKSVLDEPEKPIESTEENERSEKEMTVNEESTPENLESFTVNPSGTSETEGDESKSETTTNSPEIKTEARSKTTEIAESSTGIPEEGPQTRFEVPVIVNEPEEMKTQQIDEKASKLQLAEGDEKLIESKSSLSTDESNKEIKVGLLNKEPMSSSITLRVALFAIPTIVFIAFIALLIAIQRKFNKAKGRTVSYELSEELGIGKNSKAVIST